MKHLDTDALLSDVRRLRALVAMLGEQNSDACDRIYALEQAVVRATAERRRLRRERDVARRQLAAVQQSAQRAARAGQVEALAAELPEAWRAA